MSLEYTADAARIVDAAGAAADPRFTEYGRLPAFVAVGERRYDKVFCMLDLRGAD